MVLWTRYWKAVLRRAWCEACAVLLPGSFWDRVLKVLIFSVTMAAMFFSRGLLAKMGMIEKTDNPALDALIPALFGTVILAACFAGYFIVEAIFVSPFRIWKIANNSVDQSPFGSSAIQPESQQLATFSLRFTDPGQIDHDCNLVITGLSGKVIVTGRFAIPIHYISKSRWKWTLPFRLAEADLLTGEVVEFPYYSRPSHRRESGDIVTCLGRHVPLSWQDPDQGEMVRIEVTVHAADDMIKYDRIWKFRRASGKHFTDCLHTTGIDYPDDDQILPSDAP